ncbi:hypothetical protein IHQ71_30730 (plasmid) [Rhizobium sp. TH2]|uniref:hypothetical protein n=1 Tax=Rhizobium sp. TH2 TaxID=2775403 RepID=UPI0021585DDC|nr:hypothetical protein [Rhizobium sp. TH2]UVC12382.1 hypothetical protein IHQ71_30730 [Rhizobium sp. TH2]
MLDDDFQNEVSDEIVEFDVAQVGAICYRRDRRGSLKAFLSEATGLPDGASRKGTQALVRLDGRI